ncbi:MAG: hypothetical protein AAF950_00635 [Pseudomonadota bacterium]
MVEFNFNNAFMHFARANAPEGFFWKYLLSYVGISIASGLLTSLLYSSSSTFSGGFLAGLAGIYIFSFVILAVFEASWQRRYVRGEGFRLTFGKDEINLLVVYLIWFIFAAVMYFAIAMLFVLIVSVVTEASPTAAGIMMFLSMLVGAGLWIFWAVRLSAAGALTIRDRRIQFGVSWHVTKGRFWVLFGSQLVMFIAILVLTIAIFGTFGLFALFDVSDTSDPSQFTLFSMLTNSSSVFSGVLLFVLSMLSYMAFALFFIMWGGPAALAVRTDPERASMDDPAAAFR